MKQMIRSYLTIKNVKKVLLVIVAIVAFSYLQRTYSGVTPEMVQDFIRGFGIFGPLVFLIASAIRPLAFFPITVFYLASGLAFGTFWGGVLALTSALVGTLVAHTVTYRFGIVFFPEK